MRCVASQVTSHELGASLLPPVDHLRASSATVAVAVVRQAIADGQCDLDPGDVVRDRSPRHVVAGLLGPGELKSEDKAVPVAEG